MNHTNNFLEDIFFPNRKDNLKRVIVLSAITGVISAAIGNFFLKRVNRENIRRNFDNMSDQAKQAGYEMRGRAQEIGDNIKNSSKKRDYTDYE
jgi:hypothetical protein